MDDQQKQYDVSDGRKIAFYGGMALQVIGLIIFLSTFLVFGSHDFRSPGEFFLRPLLGMGCLMGGGMLRMVGKRGLAGSGLTIDPRQARHDMEPWNRMAGGMTQDSLDEVRVAQKFEKFMDQPNTGAKEVIKVRCRACNTLNDEDAKFCDQCGASMTA